MSFSNLSNFQHRLFIGAGEITLFAGLIYYSHHPIGRYFFFLAISVITLIAVWEYYSLSKAKGHEPLTQIGLITSFGILSTLFFFPAVPLAPLVVLLLGMIFAFLVNFRSGVRPLSNIAISLFPQLYLTFPLACLLLIHNIALEQGDGRMWIFYLLAVVKITDVAAYFFGKSLGKHKLAPFISPKKTWEGAIGGLIISIATSAAFALWTTPYLPLSLFQSICLGAILSIFSQIGDLAESLLKRDMGVKDSNCFPGFGGVLDSVDSLTFTCPLLFFYLFLVTK